MGKRAEEIAKERKIKVIPQKSREEIMGFDKDKKRRTGAYARVSSTGIMQDTSFELQVKHYTDKIKADKDLEFVKVFYDDGISGTNVTHRKGFQEMMDWAEAGKLDLIYTKSISRFARNLGDLLKYTRRLKELNVEVIFESDNVSNFGTTGDLLLKVLGIVAEFESQLKSEAITTACDWRYAQEQYMVSRMFGFDKVGKRDLVINEKEALVVAATFSAMSYGYSLEYVANLLNERGIKGLRGGAWTASGIKALISNEKYCGDLLARKTVTVDFLTHKAKKNEGEKPQYYVENHHDGIVPKNVDEFVKRIVRNRKGSKATGIPQLKPIDEGALQGFVMVNPNYSGFTFDEYAEASKKTSPNEDVVVLAQRTGYFDLRGWATVSPSLFDNGRQKPNCKIRKGSIWFSASAVREMNTEHVELLFHPSERVIAVRPCLASKAESIKIAHRVAGKLKPQKASLADFFSVIYKESGIKPEHTIRCFGERRIKRIENKRKATDEWVLFFDLREAELWVDGDIAIPKKLATEYGSQFYEKYTVSGINQIDIKELWEVFSEGRPCESLAGQMIELMPYCKQILKEFDLDIAPVQKISTGKRTERKEAL